MRFFSALVAVFAKSLASRLGLLLLFLAIWPGTMFLVGLIGESRFLPIWRDQSKAFFPGDLTLAPLALSFLMMHERTDSLPLVESVWWWLLVMALMAPVAIQLRKSDCRHHHDYFREHYNCLWKKTSDSEKGEPPPWENREAWREERNANYRRLVNSPSKIAHDVCGYYLIPALLVGLGAPQLFILRRKGVFAATRVAWLVAAICLSTYVVCAIHDARHPPEAEAVLKRRHTYEWEPFWRTQTWQNTKQSVISHWLKLRRLVRR